MTYIKCEYKKSYLFCIVFLCFAMASALWGQGVPPYDGIQHSTQQRRLPIDKQTQVHSSCNVERSFTEAYTASSTLDSRLLNNARGTTTREVVSCDNEDIVLEIQELRGSAFVNALSDIHLDCAETFFVGDRRWIPTYTEENLLVVLDSVEARTPHYDGTNNSNIGQLMAWMRGYTFSDSESLDFSDHLDRVIEVLIPFSEKEELLHFTEEQDPAENLTILSQFVILMDYSDSRGETHKTIRPFFMPFLKELLATYMQPDRLLRLIEMHPTLTAKILRIPFSFHYFTFRIIDNRDEEAQDSLAQPHNRVIIDLLENTVTPEAYENEHLSRNTVDGARVLSRMLEIPALHNYVLPKLRRIHELFPEEDHPIRLAMYGIEGAGIDLMEVFGIDRDAIEERLRARLFPNSYFFDNGRIRMHAAYDEEQALRLYYAAKEVQAQFFRVIGEDQAVANDVPGNDTLNMRIFPTLASYRSYQHFIHGLPSNNGGIYIEKDKNYNNRATFYTYERTSQESTFTVEELFRHEYVHYLQGRYLEEGSFGDGPIYDNSDKRIWYAEGTADFFSGGSQREGIKQRPSVYSRIGDRYLTPEEVFRSTYADGNDVYTYGSAFTDYLYHHKRDTLHQLFQFIRTSDISGYNDLLLALEEDEQLEVAFIDYQQELSENVPNLEDLKNVDIAEEVLPHSTEAEVRSTLIGAGLSISSSPATVLSSGTPYTNNRLGFTATIEGSPIRSDKISAGTQALSEWLDDKLEELGNNNPSVFNYAVTTAYCTNVQLTDNPDGTYTPSGDGYFEVPVRNASVSFVSKPHPEFQLQTSQEEEDRVTLTWNDYPDGAYTFYTLQRSEDETGSNPETLIENTIDKSYVDEELSYAQSRYYYRLRACKTAGSDCTAYTDWIEGRAIFLSIQNFRVAYADPAQVVLLWDKHRDADEYRIQVHYNRQLTTLGFTTDTTFTATRDPSENKKYYYFIRHFHGRDTRLSIRNSPIELALKQTDIDIAITWNQSYKYDITYTLERSYQTEDNALAALATSDDREDEGIYTEDLTQLPGGTYFYRVKLSSADDNHSYTSAWQEINVEEAVAAQPAITSFSPAEGAVGTEVTITGTGFSATADENSIAFGNDMFVVASSVRASVAADPDTLTVVVPATAETGPLSVKVLNGTAAISTEIFTMTVTAVAAQPAITSFSPAEGAVGTEVTITGTGFSATAGENSIAFGNDVFVVASSVRASVATDPDTLTVVVPATAETGILSVKVLNGTAAISTAIFTMTVEEAVAAQPAITSFSPAEGAVGTEVTITGTGFSATADENSIAFGNDMFVVASSVRASVAADSDTLTVVVPATAETGPLSVKVLNGTAAISTEIFTMTVTAVAAQPAITSFSPAEGAVGTEVTITGTGFSATAGENSIAFGNDMFVVASSVRASMATDPDTLTVVVPATAKTGTLSVKVLNGTAAISTATFTVTVEEAVAAQPAITSFSPAEGAVGTEVTITGTGFSATADENSIAFGNDMFVVASSVRASVAADPDTLTVVVSATAETGILSVKVLNGTAAISTATFTMTVEEAVAAQPAITSFSPAEGAVGTEVTITGTGFSATADENSITFGNDMFVVASSVRASVAADPDTLTVVVPATAETGPLSVKVLNGTAAISTAIFTMTVEEAVAAQPAITSFSPAEGAVGTEVTITGTGFSATADENSIAFGNDMFVVASSVRASVAADPDTLTVVVPATAETGPLSVKVLNGTAAISTATFTMTVTNVLDVPLVADEVRLYPNPASGQLRFTNLLPTQSYTYRIYGVAGTRVQTGELRGNGDIDVSRLRTGRYVLLLYDRDGSTILRSNLLVQ